LAETKLLLLPVCQFASIKTTLNNNKKQQHW